jgi:membrane protein
VTTWNIVTWPALLVLVSLMFAILYRALPDAETGGFRWISPGGIFAVLRWLLASAAFAIYLAKLRQLQQGLRDPLQRHRFHRLDLDRQYRRDARAETRRVTPTRPRHHRRQDPADEPFFQLGDRKIKGSEQGLSTI